MTKYTIVSNFHSYILFSLFAKNTDTTGYNRNKKICNNPYQQTAFVECVINYTIDNNLMKTINSKAVFFNNPYRDKQPFSQNPLALQYCNT